MARLDSFYSFLASVWNMFGGLYMVQRAILAAYRLL